jgi:hypothetical protein
LLAVARQVGERAEFWVNDALNNTYRQATATLKLITPDLYMWVEDGFQARAEDLEASAHYFAEATRPIQHRIFGEEWIPGVDGDPRLHVFNGNVPGVGGYFYSQDEYPAAVIPFSNEREIFFVNLQSTTAGTDGYNALLAHEFQHMIQWHNDPDEEAWVNEGLSELATRMSGLPVYNYTTYLRSPDIALMDWPLRTANSGPHYGGNHLLMEYLMGQFGEDFVRELAQTTSNGVAGIQQALQRRGADFPAVFRDWTVATLLDSSGLAGSRYEYPAIGIPAPDSAQLLSLPATISDTVQPFGVDYLSIPITGTIRVDFTGQITVPLAPFAAEPGDHLWWSNRGDNKDTTLTRELDLTGAPDATLRASLWYAIETGYDFAHPEASTDGGATWIVLPGQRTQPAAPGSMALGAGYTGNSGGGAQPQWVEETYSLAPFAGKRILLRFECITDDAINLEGFWIRSLEVPEIGWSDDGESPEGWSAQGFVRVENALPQRYLVTAVLNGATPEVVPIEVGPDGSASATLNAPQGMTLIVSAATEHTRQPAPYALRLAGESR